MTIRLLSALQVLGQQGAALSGTLLQVDDVVVLDQAVREHHERPGQLLLTMGETADRSAGSLGMVIGPPSATASDAPPPAGPGWTARERGYGDEREPCSSHE
jgi:hypothetical protein